MPGPDSGSLQATVACPGVGAMGSTEVGTHSLADCKLTLTSLDRWVMALEVWVPGIRVGYFLFWTQ